MKHKVCAVVWELQGGNLHSTFMTFLLQECLAAHWSTHAVEPVPYLSGPECLGPTPETTNTIQEPIYSNWAPQKAAGSLGWSSWATTNEILDKTYYFSWAFYMRHDSKKSSEGLILYKSFSLSLMFSYCESLKNHSILSLFCNLVWTQIHYHAQISYNFGYCYVVWSKVCFYASKNRCFSVFSRDERP